MNDHYDEFATTYGLETVEFYGDFKGTPFGPGSEEQVWVAKQVS